MAAGLSAPDLDTSPRALHTLGKVQVSFKKGKEPRNPVHSRDVHSNGSVSRSHRKLTDLREGEAGVIDAINVPAELASRLMELGFMAGNSVTAARCAPGGDPRVFRVDGAEIALRHETASRLTLKS